EYRPFMQNETIPALKKGGVKLRNTLVTANFGEALEYITVEPAESLKQFDGQAPLLKALGDESNRAWSAKWLRMIAGSHTYLVQLRPDLSVNMPKPGTPHTKLAFSVRITVAPGRVQEYESYVKADVLPILQKAYPKGVLVSKVVVGGNCNEYFMVVFADSFEELEKSAQVATREGFTRIQPKTAGIILHTENNVLRYVPELSISPSAPKTGSKE
ncbi:MAG: hypothetical protein AAB401_04110, partial [Acidobacteriota bacterium]